MSTKWLDTISKLGFFFFVFIEKKTIKTIAFTFVFSLFKMTPELEVSYYSLTFSATMVTSFDWIYCVKTHVCVGSSGGQWLEPLPYNKKVPGHRPFVPVWVCVRLLASSNSPLRAFVGGELANLNYLWM